MSAHTAKHRPQELCSARFLLEPNWLLFFRSLHTRAQQRANPEAEQAPGAINEFLKTSIHIYRKQDTSSLTFLCMYQTFFSMLALSLLSQLDGEKHFPSFRLSLHLSFSAWVCFILGREVVRFSHCKKNFRVSQIFILTARHFHLLEHEFIMDNENI